MLLGFSIFCAHFQDTYQHEAIHEAHEKTVNLPPLVVPVVVNERLCGFSNLIQTLSANLQPLTADFVATQGIVLGINLER